MATEEREEQESAAEEQASAATAAAAPAPDLSADNDPLTGSDGELQPGLLQRLNPMRLLRKRNTQFYIDEGKDLLAAGSFAQAMVAFKKALDMDENCIPAYRGLGKVFYKKGGRQNMETALSYYQEAIKHNPREHDLYAITAKIYDALGKRKEATLERKKFVIVRALDADARNPVANNNMGILYLQQGRQKDALDYFNRAVRADKNYDVAHRNLAAAYFQMAREATGEDKKAEFSRKSRESIDKAVKIARTPASLMAQVRVLMMDGDLEKVLDILEEVDRMTPANKDVYYLKKMALEGLGRFDEAREANDSYLAFKMEDTRAATAANEDAGAAE